MTRYNQQRDKEADRRTLAEVDDVLRCMPPRETLKSGSAEALSWLGRAAAVIERWDFTKGASLAGAVHQIQGGSVLSFPLGFAALVTLLHQARHDLLLEVGGPVNVVAGQGMVFEYFDGVRRLIEAAKADVLFVDPYLDAEFVSRYLASVTAGVTIRLLGRERLGTLLPAVDQFVAQSKRPIEVRSADSFHDRYVFIDRKTCHQSGASFKDGARTSPTTITEIIDAFGPVLETYERIWANGKTLR